MALCVEPGIEIPGIGGALIEHEVIVGEGAPRFLCVTPSLS
jgi:Xaa-Pro aminopeptidase